MGKTIDKHDLKTEALAIDTFITFTKRVSGLASASKDNGVVAAKSKFDGDMDHFDDAKHPDDDSDLSDEQLVSKGVIILNFGQIKKIASVRADEDDESTLKKSGKSVMTVVKKYDKSMSKSSFSIKANTVSTIISNFTAKKTDFENLQLLPQLEKLTSALSTFNTTTKTLKKNKTNKQNANKKYTKRGMNILFNDMIRAIESAETVHGTEGDYWDDIETAYAEQSAIEKARKTRRDGDDSSSDTKKK